MTPPDSEPEADPHDLDASERQVQRLLAEAGLADPMPTDVAARLDDVLGSLVRERAATAAAPVGAPDDTSGDRADVAPPVDLTAERMRRRRVWVGAAAAAVVVVAAGITLPQWLNSSDSASDSTSTAAGERDADIGRLPALASESSRAEVTALVRSLDASSAGAELLLQDRSGEDGSEEDLAAGPSAAPSAPPSGRRGAMTEGSQCGWTGPGRLLHPITYDGAPADLVLRVTDGVRVAMIITCADASTPTVARSVILRPGN